MIKRIQVKLRIPLFTLCSYCEADLADTWDHIRPVYWGGNNSVNNLTPACRRCNIMAGKMLFEGFDDKKAYIRYRRLLIKKPRKIIVLAPKIIIPEVKIIKPQRFTLANIIKNGNIHLKSIRAGIECDVIFTDIVPIGQWVEASVDNALFLALGDSKLNRHKEVCRI